MPAPTLSFVLYCNLQFQRPSINLNFMLPSFPPSHTLPPFFTDFSRRALIQPLLPIIMRFHSESLRLSASGSPSCDVAFNWHMQRQAQLKDHTHVTWHVGLKVGVGCICCYWCYDVGIWTLNGCWTLSERGKMQFFLLCNKCKSL